MKGILGIKIGMTQIFNKKGKLIPVTIVSVVDNHVIRVAEQEKNDYISTTLATINKRKSLVNRPDLGQFTKLGLEPKRYIKEIRNMTGYQPGDVIKVDLFEEGEFVDVTSISKGKGFAGSIKRHNYSRGPMAHGSGYHRGVGSMGAIAPNRIFKSKKMPGHMGHEQVTIQGLEVIEVNLKNEFILIKGSIPGPKKQMVIIKNSVKKTIKKTPEEIIYRNEIKPISKKVKTKIVKETVKKEAAKTTTEQKVANETKPFENTKPIENKTIENKKEAAKTESNIKEA